MKKQKLKEVSAIKKGSRTTTYRIIKNGEVIEEGSMLPAIAAKKLIAYVNKVNDK